MLTFTLQANARVPLTANVVDQLGEPAAAEAISWSVGDESVACLDVTSGGSVNLVAHAEGSTTVALTVGSLTTLLHVTVATVVASAVSIEIGAPVAKAVALPVVEEPAVAETHAETVHAPEAAAVNPAPVEAAVLTEATHSAEPHVEAPHAGEATGREAAEFAAPPAPVEPTAHTTPAAA